MASAVVLQADAAHLPLPDASVDLVVTSPPYFGLRSYEDDGQPLVGQIGIEDTPQEYIAALLDCTREWMRVLKPSGSIFVNLGDKYSSGAGPHTGEKSAALRSDKHGHGGGPKWVTTPRQPAAADMPPKTLMGLPWRYAIGCTDQLGLILRRDIIWHKANPLPESVTDRCRSAHEYLFHFVKQPRYYSAIDVIREPHTMKPQRRPNGRPEDRTPRPGQPKQTWPTAQRDEVGVDGHLLGKLPGSVWKIATQPLRLPVYLGVKHHAAFPMALVRPVIRGWSPPGGIVADPFGGTGTAATVAVAYGRIGITADLSAGYCRAAQWRTGDSAELAKARGKAKSSSVKRPQKDVYAGALAAMDELLRKSS